MRARLGAYAALQLRDFLTGRALLVVLLVGAFVGWQIGAMSTGVGRDWATGVEGRARALRLFDDLLLLLALAGALAGAPGLIARDRRRGFARLLFCRPVGVPRYYAQLFIVRGLALVGIAALAAQLYSLFVRPVPVGGAVAYVAIVWLAVGGIGFLLSALTNRDGLLLVLLLVVGVAVSAYRSAPSASAAGAAVATAAQYVLPPVQVLVSLRATFARGATPDPQQLGWAVGFGAICLAAGLLALRRRPPVA